MRGNVLNRGLCWTLVLGLSMALGAGSLRAEPKKPARAPQLVLLVVVDQLRADYLTRFSHLLSERGFKRLMKLGATFPKAEYEVLQSMTGPGHAVISTGANPHYSGIAGNTWWEAHTATRTYCVADPQSALLPEQSGQGISPKNLITSTFGDELKNAGFGSRVVAIALKDRAAVLLGGHRADLALWFQEGSQHWATSRFYAPDGKLPAFVEILNASLDRRQERSNEQGADRNALAGPYGFQLTLEAVEMAWNHFGFGRRAATDVLAVSFSSFDYAGHQHGPNSPEMEATFVAQDKALANLLDLAEKRVPGGLSKTLVAVTADHGVAPVPETLARPGAASLGGRIDESELKTRMETALVEKFGKAKSSWILGVESLQVFLNEPLVREKGLSLSELEGELQRVLALDPRWLRVWTRSDLTSGQASVHAGFVERQWHHTYVPGRSGSVTLVPKPFWIPSEAKTTHVTGYAYDREVPLILAGPGIKPGRYFNATKVNDLAPTLSALLGTVAPAMNEGRVLHEALYGVE